MFENTKDFYPTPYDLIEKMLSTVNFYMVKSILEPSAGKGDIVDAIKKATDPKFRWDHDFHLDIDCIEVNPDLRHILKGKGYRVVHDDFLTFDTMKEYDLIIMNPPFSNGCKHLTKALQMQEISGGAIICLLNAETLRNPCTNERLALIHKLEEYHAEIQYLPGAFSDAERKTDVEIALIKVNVPAPARPSFIFDKLLHAQDEEFIDPKYEETQLAENDLIRAIVKQYKREVTAGIQLIKEYRAMAPHILSSYKKDSDTGEVTQDGSCVLSLVVGKEPAAVNNFIREIRGKYWEALFNNPKFAGQLTNNLYREYRNRINELKDYDFSLYNIYEIKVDMCKRVSQGIEDTIISLFDELSQKYSYYDETSNNIHYFNGWKTNKSWFINKKVILPLAGYHNLQYSFGGFDPTRYDVIRKLQDIEKCLNYLDGGLTDAVDLEATLKAAKEEQQTKNIKLKYGSVTFYKKGTCHIVFENEELLKKFNIFGSQHKGWLPPSYGKKRYSDMDPEEQAVVDSFEGEKAYNEVINNAPYYLCQSEDWTRLLA
jgi:hypothetical protein